MRGAFLLFRFWYLSEILGELAPYKILLLELIVQNPVRNTDITEYVRTYSLRSEVTSGCWWVRARDRDPGFSALGKQSAHVLKRTHRRRRLVFVCSEHPKLRRVDLRGEIRVCRRSLVRKGRERARMHDVVTRMRTHPAAKFAERVVVFPLGKLSRPRCYFAEI